jgi:hypothetical protein
MVLPLPRPGLLRGIGGMIVMGLAFGLTYHSIGTGGIWMVTALLMLAMGVLLGGWRGLFTAAVFIVPVSLLLYYPIPLPSEQFGVIMLAFAVYLGIIPGIIVALGFVLRKVVGALIAALLIVPGYITFLVAFPFPLTAGASSGASFMFAAVGMAFGFVWGVGAASPGATAHEGPTYIAAVSAKPRPNPVRMAREKVIELLPFVRNLILPLIRPLLIALGIAVVISGALLFVATNPIVPVSRRQTFDAAAAAEIVTGEKLLLFIVIAIAILGAVATFAVLMALGINALNKQVNEAKKEKPEPLDTRTVPGSPFAEFLLNWVNDILNVLRRSVTR